jgi:D-xylulose reductase
MEPGIPDYTSRETLQGMYNLDPDVRFWATPPIHGCLRESIVHPANLTFKLPDNVSFEEGALVEPLAIGVHSVKKARIAPGDTALVLGAGTIGLVTALAAVAAGCSHVIVADSKQEKLDFIGKHYDSRFSTFNIATGDLKAHIAKEFPQGVNIVFEASGNPKAILSTTRFVGAGGKVVLIGMPQEPAAIDIVEAQCKEVEFLTIFRYANVYDRAIKYIASGQINVKPLITHRFELKDVVKAFDFAAGMPGDAIKIMISLPA